MVPDAGEGPVWGGGQGDRLPARGLVAVACKALRTCQHKLHWPVQNPRRHGREQYAWPDIALAAEAATDIFGIYLNRAPASSPKASASAERTQLTLWAAS